MNDTPAQPPRLSRLPLTRRRLIQFAATAAATIPAISLLTACGGSSSPSTATQAASSAATAASSPATTPAPGTTATAETSPSASPAGSPATTPAAAGSPSTGAGTGTTITSQPIAFAEEPVKHQGGKLIEGSIADAKTLAPVLSTDTVSGAVIGMLFDGVIQTDPKHATPTGRLAKSWEISTDGMRYAFTLHDGVTFHDGTPLTAEDVKFTYDLILNPATKSPVSATVSERIAAVEVTSPTAVTFRLKAPNAAFLVSNMGYGIMPKHLLKDVAPAALAASPFSLGKKGVTIGSGPFQFSEWVKDDHVTLVKYPHYWQGAPALDQWILTVVPNQTVLVQKLKTGEVDYGLIGPADVADMQKSSTVGVHVYEDFRFLLYVYQLDTAKTTIFQDQAVRQALFYALPREEIVKSIVFGYATVAVGTMPKPSWAYNPAGIKRTYGYDLDKANQLLDQAGWKKGSDGIRAKDGKKLAFSVWTLAGNQVYAQYVAVFQQQWKKLGVVCTPKPTEQNAFIDRMTGTHDFEMGFFGFAWPVDPDQTTMWACASYTGGWNTGRYCNPAVDKLLAEGLATTDRSKRRQIYTEMQNTLLEDLPSGVMDFTQGLVGLNKRVHNYFPNAINTRFNAYQWWVDA